MKKIPLTPEWAIVSDIWSYKDGNLYWRIKCGRSLSVKHIGDKVNVIPDSLGYANVTYRRKKYAVHRVIFLLVHAWLPEQIDHIDGNPLNNRVENLRPASPSQNMWNAKLRSDNTSGVKGVSWCKKYKKWEVGVQTGYKRYRRKFEDLELAELVAIEARDKFHREFARHA